MATTLTSGKIEGYTNRWALKYGLPNLTIQVFSLSKILLNLTTMIGMRISSTIIFSL
jgi:hypothetical protein